MCIFLFFGLIAILLAVFLWCVLPCLYFCWLKPLIERAQGQRGELEGSQINKVLEGLKKTPFDPSKFVHDNKCSICMCEYEKDE